ncbi:pyruvate formate-lyase-activating protein [Planomonospora corallina]|uniref:Pyruvate formate-lyase-activating enzyme n=1 Tax=Planomonospora corallina TaxID=1806052 RepID=A0ABV8IEL8_9ACTN
MTPTALPAVIPTVIPTGAPAPAGTPAGSEPVIGSVHSWDISTGVDGPGTRFVVFTSGCPLRCLYCHNPDTWRMRDGTRTTVDELVARAERYRRFVQIAGGGVTVSGGEPLMQPVFTGEILRRCRELGLHTALDTSGYLGHRASDALLADTDLVLLDIKSWNPATYRKVTTRDLDPTVRFARRLAELERPTWVRFVLVPGLTDAEENVDGLAAFVATLPNVEHVDVLPYHRMAESKYGRLGLPYPLPGTEPPSAELLERVHAQFRAHGVRSR